MNLTNMQGLLQAIGALAIASNGALQNVYAGLFTGAPIINRGINMANLTEATFAGYSRLQITNWGNILNLPNGGGCVVGPRLQWQANASLNTTQTVTGAFLANGSVNGTLLAAGFFDVPQTVRNPGDGIDWVPAEEFGWDTDYADLPGAIP